MISTDRVQEETCNGSHVVESWGRALNVEASGKRYEAKGEGLTHMK